MGLINPILVNSTNANDATAVGGSVGQLVYQINTTTNRCDVFIYYKAYVPTTAIVNGSVLSPATLDQAAPGATNSYFQSGTADRASTGSFNGISAVSHPFFGVAMASMTANYYGYAQRAGLHTAVKTNAITSVRGDNLCVSASATPGEAAKFSTVATGGGTTGTTVEEGLNGHIGLCIVGATTSTSTVLLAPALNFVGA
jgi:hypothetical protein